MHIYISKYVYMCVQVQQKVAILSLAPQPAQRPFSAPRDAVTSTGTRTPIWTPGRRVLQCQLCSIPASYKVLECACKFGTLVRSCMGMFWFSWVCSCSTGCMLSNKKHSFIEKKRLKGTSWACNTSNKAMQTCSTTSTCSDEEGGWWRPTPMGNPQEG